MPPLLKIEEVAGTAARLGMPATTAPVKQNSRYLELISNIYI